MVHFFLDFVIVFILIILITALLGVLLQAFAKLLTSRKTKFEVVYHLQRIQSGWNQVGGKNPPRS